MTQVLTLAGGGDSGDPSIETAAAVGRIMRAAVSLASVAGDSTPQRAASQALRALSEPIVLLAALARDEPARPIWRRIVQTSAKPVILVPVAARGQPGRPLGTPAAWSRSPIASGWVSSDRRAACAGRRSPNGSRRPQAQRSAGPARRSRRCQRLADGHGLSSQPAGPGG
jgi:hypothetical protein